MFSALSFIFGIKIPLSMQECRSHLNIFTLAFLSRRAFVLPGLIEILSNTWSICSAGWRVGWAVKFIWIGNLMNKSTSYRCLKKIPPPELFLVRFIMKYLVNAQLQLRFIQSGICLDIHSFHETQAWEMHIHVQALCPLFISLQWYCMEMYILCRESRFNFHILTLM